MLRSALLLALAGAASVAVLTPAPAQEDPIAKRRAIYKSYGQAAKEPGQMLKGEVPFELAKVQSALRLFQSTTPQLRDLFPENSRTGGDTAALPIIWEDRPRFIALFNKFDEDTAAALASIKDEASFKTEFPKVLADCGACHNTFRLKR